MRIAGIEKNSFVDYPGKIASVIFTQGCNMDCFYCHNRDLICRKNGPGFIKPEAALKLLESRKRFIDGVVITGGEPTLQRGLAEFIADIRSLGFLVKLDTNGTNPDLLGELVHHRQVDYVAMDIKAPLNRYEEICGIPVSLEKINRSIDLLIRSGIEYEFRTTLVPQLTQADVIEICRRIQGARHYVLQQYRRPASVGDVVDYRLLQPPHMADYFTQICATIGDMVQSCKVRGVI